MKITKVQTSKNTKNTKSSNTKLSIERRRPIKEKRTVGLTWAIKIKKAHLGRISSVTNHNKDYKMTTEQGTGNRNRTGQTKRL